MATEIEPLIMPFDPLWVTTSKQEYREAVRRMGEEPGDAKGKDGLTSCIPGKGCVICLEDGQGKTQIQNDIRRCRRTLLDLWKLIGKEI